MRGTRLCFFRTFHHGGQPEKEYLFSWRPLPFPAVKPRPSWRNRLDAAAKSSLANEKSSPPRCGVRQTICRLCYPWCYMYVYGCGGVMATNKVTTTTARPPTPAVTRLSSDKMPETPETCRSLSLYTSPIMEHPRPPPRPLEPLAFATALRTMQAITQMHASRELFAHVVADRPMAVRPPSQLRL